LVCVFGVAISRQKITASYLSVDSLYEAH